MFQFFKCCSGICLWLIFAACSYLAAASRSCSWASSKLLFFPSSNASSGALNCRFNFRVIVFIDEDCLIGNDVNLFSVYFYKTCSNGQIINLLILIYHFDIRWNEPINQRSAWCCRMSILPFAVGITACSTSSE